MDSLIQDLRYSMRMLWKSPGFSVIAVVTLALGIGATTAMFSVVDQALIAPLPYERAEQLVHVDWKVPGKIAGAESLNAMQIQYVQQNSRSFSSTAAMFYAPGCNLVSGDHAEYVNQVAVSADFFRTFAVKPELGRLFAAEDALSKPAQVAIIGNELWRGKLGGDAGIVGKTIKCNGLPYTVIGVLPKTFSFPEEDGQVWIPDRIENYASDTGSNYWFAGRLRDGVTMEQAQQELASMAPRFHKEYPKYAWDNWIGADGRWNLVPLQEWRVGDQKRPLLMLFAAVSLVLLIAAANVAGLILARATGRSRELATRMALGASRGRVIRQLLTETVLLSVIGGIGSLVLAVWTLGLLNPMLPAAVRSEAGAKIDIVMLSFALAMSLLAGVFAGIIPALQATKGDLYWAVKQGDRGASGGHNRWRKALVASEVALALLLLVGSTLLVRSFVALRGVRSGVNPHGVTVAYMSLGNPRYQKTAAVENFRREVLARVSTIPGVSSAATITAVPGRRDLNQGARMGTCPNGAGGAVSYRAISPTYFATVGIPLVRGRVFREGESEPIAIANEAFARNPCWGGKDPVGMEITMGRDDRRVVVGIVGDTHDYGPASRATPTIYVPQWQVPDRTTAYSNGIFFWSVVTRSGNVAGLGEAIQRAIREVDPEQPVVAVVPLETILGNWLKEARSIMQLMTAFAGLALLLTAVGLYGVLSYYVTQRTREIGIRMALGATQRHVLGRVIGEGLVLAGIGSAAGLAAALAATRLIKSLLFGVQANDPLTLALAVGFLAAVTFAASFIPACRATRVDPVIALRYE